MNESYDSPLVTVRELSEHVGRRVTLRGWLYNRRSKKTIHFLEVRDGTGIVQAIASQEDVDEDTFALAGRLAQEAAIRVTGTVQADERAQGGVELVVHALELIAAPHAEYPIPISRDVPNVDFLIQRRHLWLRSKKPWATLRIRHETIQAIRDFFYQRDFVCFDAPIFTPNACEGTTTLFPVPYFELGEAYLTQSGQLYEEAGALAFGKVYNFGPVFRAEKSKTRKHLTEFWMIEPEMAFAELDDVMELAEQFVAYVVGRVLERCQTELKMLGRDTAELEGCTKLPYPRISYAEACRLIAETAPRLKDESETELRDKALKAMRFDEREVRKRMKGEAPKKVEAELAAQRNDIFDNLIAGAMKPEGESAHSLGDDFGAPDETILSLHYDQPVLVHRWPEPIKAFYMKADAQNPGYVLGVDMIAPNGYGEIIGGGQREDDLTRLEEQVRKHELPQEEFEWYLDLRRFGSVPHGGFGLGLERTVAWLCGSRHIRETIPFARTIDRHTP